MDSSTSNRRIQETSGRNPGPSVALQMKESKIGGRVGDMMIACSNLHCTD